MNIFFEWLNMGGYACYVWPAFFIVSGSLIINLFLVNKQKTNVKNKLNKWLQKFE